MNGFQPFAMERWQSVWENRVEYNLSESGVHPLTLGELLELAGEPIDDVRLGYGQSNGTELLRAHIASLYPGANIDNVCVANGSAEINFVALWALASPGHAVAVVTPTYMQAPGLAASLGAVVRPIPLHEEMDWQPDPDEVSAAITPDTSLVVVTNPGNPTGTVLSDDARDALVRAADRVGAWILADEVYNGAEFDGVRTRSFWGSSSRVIATGSLSKAYGLPGLRIGWAIAPPEMADRLWARKDYTTIGPGELTDRLATLALSPEVRPRILDRTRTRIRQGWRIVDEWFRGKGCFRCRPPDAGAICFARFDLPIDSTSLAERLRVEKSVLIVPGDQFERDGFIRIGFGPPEPALHTALDRFADLIEELRQTS